jgi:hypothetical protein
VKLTRGATHYLAQLERVAIPSTAFVEKRLAGRMPQVPAVWLDFHERYGGYVEPISSTEDALFGLMFFETQWFTPMECELEDDPAADNAYIMCADVNPSYNFQLDKHGHLFAGPAECFEIHLERAALGKEFREGCANGTTFHFKRDELEAALAAEFDQLLAGEPVAEASDKYHTYFRSEHLLVRRSARGQFSIWQCQ